MHIPRTAITTRGFGNSFEGVSVPAGKRYAVGEAVSDLPFLSVERYSALRKAGLVEPEGAVPVVARVRPTEAAPPPSQTQRAESESASPKPARRRRGSRTGTEAQPSSSPEGQAQ